MEIREYNDYLYIQFQISEKWDVQYLLLRVPTYENYMDLEFIEREGYRNYLLRAIQMFNVRTRDLDLNIKTQGLYFSHALSEVARQALGQDQTLAVRHLLELSNMMHSAFIGLSKTPFLDEEGHLKPKYIMED